MNGLAFKNCKCQLSTPPTWNIDK